MDMMDIAVVGLSCRYAGGVKDGDSYWKFLAEGGDGWSRVPLDRWKGDSFWHPDPEANGMTNHRGGYFLRDDISKFDATFFGIAPNEAHAMDPQQRLLLQGVYEAFENAGLRLEDVAGTDTAVYAAAFSRDYQAMSNKDTEAISRYYFTGVGDAILANRVSYLFDLHGPSITLDTGCSGSLVAVHMACQSLRTGDSSMAIASGVNLMLHPDQQIPMSLAHFLNNEGRCYAFDKRGSGYGRGEGMGTVVLQRLEDAIRAGRNIRSVIRASGTNQDGRTNGITLPSQQMQEELARRVYRSARLDPKDTPVVEAHGTGTEAGDIAEIGGIINVFASQGQPPIIIGSVKPNIGHAESASGIAGLIKGVLMLERGLISPQSSIAELKPGLQKLSSSFDIAQRVQKWPDGACRRISVSSFGYGGTNSHVVMDAYQPQTARFDAKTQLRLHQVDLSGADGGHEHRTVVLNEDDDREQKHLVVLSARSEKSLLRYCDNLRDRISSDHSNVCDLSSLAHTLAHHRTWMPWRASAVVATHDELFGALEKKTLRTVRIPSVEPRLVFLFTGQGAQWYGMGCELLQSSPVFSRSIRKSSKLLLSMGANWDLVDELRRDKETSRLHQSKIGQPASTAIQIALVDLLRSASIVPTSVIGHSSGEIAAAYCVQALSHEAAIAVAFHRSFLGSLSSQVMGRNGAMAAIGLPEDDVLPLLADLKTGVATVACLNDPRNTTISGDETAVDEVVSMLDPSVFARKLNVDTAYHSHFMEAVKQQYRDSMAAVQDEPKLPDVEFISSVSGSTRLDEFGPEYWARNLVSKVRFLDAVQHYCDKHKHNSYTFVEVGPHSILCGSIRRILSSTANGPFQFTCVPSLERNKDAKVSILELLGQLFAIGHSFDAHSVWSDTGVQPLSTLPPYAWDCTKSYWRESRLSKEHRHRSFPPHDLLGLRIVGSDPQEPSWRHVFSLDTLPWLREHAIDGSVVFPGTGYVTMAIEAIRQIHQENDWPAPKTYELRNLRFLKALIVPEPPASMESVLRFYRPRDAGSKTSSGWYSFRLSSVNEEAAWTEHCTGSVRINYQTVGDESAEHVRLRTKASLHALKLASHRCKNNIDKVKMYEELADTGNVYGANFAVLQDVCVEKDQVIARVVTPNISASMPMGFQRPHLVHPATIDALLHMHIPLFKAMGGSGSVMPIEVDKITISARIHNRPHDEFICLGNLSYINGRSAIAESIAFQEDPESGLTSVVHIENGELRALGESGMYTVDDASLRETTYRMAWVKNSRFLRSEDLITQHSHYRPQERQQEARRRETLFNELATLCICDSVAEVQQLGLSIPDTYLRHYFAWMQRHADALSSRTLRDQMSQQHIQEALKAAQDYDVEGEVLRRLRESLTDIVCGDVDPLSLYMEGGLYQRLYNSDAASLRCAKSLRTYIQCLADDKGQLKVLEIGAGTGSTTAALLQGGSTETSLPVWLYHFTDISSGFHEQARQAFLHFEEHMQYSVLDIEQDPEPQGFELGSYDLIIASNVIHATSPLSRSLLHIRKLLKPNGVLALIEVIRMSPAYNLMFGALPGWWKGVADGRIDTPFLSPERWDEEMRESGCNGIDIVVPDADGPSPSAAFMLATPQDHIDSDTHSLRTIKFVCSPRLDTASLHFVEQLQKSAKKRSIEVVHLHGDGEQSDDSDVYLVVDAGNDPILDSPDTSLFSDVINLATTKTRVLWISVQGDRDSCRNPKKAFVTGFARSARSECPTLKLVTVDVQQKINDTGINVVPIILDILDQAFYKSLNQSSEDYEYIISHNRVLSPRLMPDSALNKLCYGTDSTTNLGQLAFFHDQSRPLKLTVETPGLLDSMRFVDDLAALQLVADDEIEIKVHAFGVNFKDVFIALGQMKATSSMVGECAGVVTAVGADFERQYQIGDRVCASNGTPYASRCRVKGDTAVHLPETMTYETAASFPVAFATAHYGLVRVAVLSKGQSVLIHGAAGGVGQAAIIIALDAGAEVFATVGSHAKKELLVANYGIAEDHIFSSRNGDFKAGITRLTKGKGVDAVLNSTSGDMLHDSWACVAKFGTFVEVGKADIYKKSLISMEHFDRNVTFASVDLAVISNDRPSLMRQILAEVVAKFREGRYRPVTPVTAFPLSDVEQAFRLIQGRKHTGKLVLTAAEDEMVKSIPPQLKPLSLNHTGTYLISGGLGEIAKRLVVYMAAHGAKHFVLLTRRSLDHHQQAEALRTYEGMDLDVVIKTCDVTDRTAVQQLIDDCEINMPPIKGAIQAAVVLRDRVLETMTADDWHQVMSPKVEGTKNLIDVLTPLCPDFLLLLSSCAAIAGTRGSSNYNAANAYLDAVANLSTDHAPFIAALDVGMLPETKIVNAPGIIQSLLRQGVIIITFEEMLRLAGYLMSPQARKDGVRQIAMAIDRKSLSAHDDLFTLRSAMFNHLPYPKRRLVEGHSKDAARSDDVAHRIKLASGSDEALAIATEALVTKIVALVASDEVTADSSVANLGVDSLIAIELKNWLSRVFKANVQTTDILDASSIHALASKVIVRSSLFNGPDDLDMEDTKKDSAKSHCGNESGRSPEPTNGTTNLELPSQPLPKLEESLNGFLATAALFGTRSELEHTAKVVKDFQSYRGIGLKLQAQLEETVSNGKEWLADIYADALWLKHRTPARPLGTWFATHALSPHPHSQSERAALVTLAAFDYKQRLEAGSVEMEVIQEQSLDMASHKWLFNSYRRPATGCDVAESHPGNQFVAVMRKGHLFKVFMESRSIRTDMRGLALVFQHIIEKALPEVPLASILTTDDRSFWARNRQELVKTNPTYLQVIEKSLFVVYLDDGSPVDAEQRANQFILDDNISRWNDKPLSFIVTTNGVSASYFEHSLFDGSTVNQLTAEIAAAVQSYKPHTEANTRFSTASGPLEPHYEHVPVVTTPEINAEIARCSDLWKAFIAPFSFQQFQLDGIGQAFFQKHKIPVSAGVQMVIQLALRLALNHNPPSWDPVSMRHFHRGRLELVQVVTPAVKRFCEMEARVNGGTGENMATAQRRKIFLSAAASYTASVNDAVKGKAWDRHLQALLHQARVSRQSSPDIFSDPLYLRTRPEHVITGGYTGIRDAEMNPAFGPEFGLVWNRPEAIWTRFDPYEDYCHFFASNGTGKLSAYFQGLQRAADTVKSIMTAEK